MLEYITNNENIEQYNYLKFKIDINFNKKARILYHIIIDNIIDNNKIFYKRYIYRNAK